MALHSRIGLLNYDGSITSIYSEEVFSRNLLKYCYGTRAKVRELLDKGDLRPIKYEGTGNVVPDPSSARTDANLSDYVSKGEYYNYLFDGEFWTVYFNIGGDKTRDYNCRFGFVKSDHTIISINYWVYDKPEEIITLLNKQYSTENDVLTLMQNNGIGDVNIFPDDNDIVQLVFWPDPYYYVPPRIDDIPSYWDSPYIPNGEYCNFVFNNQRWTYNNECWTYYCQQQTTL